MKTTQYVRQEKAIAAGPSEDMRRRWIWGLRLVRDPDAFAPGSSQLKKGRADELVAAHKAAGLNFSATEMRLRIQCARTYQTESEFNRMLLNFRSWRAVCDAGFPAYERDPDEPLADHRTDAERKHDHGRALLDHIGDQGAFFPLSDFEPITTTVKEMRVYAEAMVAMASSFHEHAKERLAYVDQLSEAVDGDESVTWQDAQDRLDGEPS